MAKVDISSYGTYDEITKRLDEIVAAVRDKDTSLEHSLDLFDEAIELGSKAVDMVDDVHLTAEEAAQLEADEAGSTDQPEADEAASTSEVSDAASEDAPQE